MWQSLAHVAAGIVSDESAAFSHVHAMSGLLYMYISGFLLANIFLTNYH